ncbi:MULTISPECIES: hypothetical protein [Roseobacteraceae]|uniref:Lysozyme inhibitor LprI N-terminal domain-containing protein n=1 Tax=Pseudosulfitobacter pseudonitzschiae TaxID=1402135 RepID=A0A221JZL4_9RHOB|nr:MULTISPECIES: hypothetical protein [Roseobacteraceae]ASM72182.1 hypothetical protein SULPSESMR1_01362 [Pseudosulfitobacter pseudonitzschiae]
MKTLICAVTFAALCSPLWGQVQGAEACLAKAMQNGTDPTLCLDAPDAACMDNAQETPVVSTSCFAENRAQWGAAIGKRMDMLPDTTDTTVARIEARYDVIGAMVQCDRIEALAKAASDLSGPQIALQKERCLARANALTYVRLFARTHPAVEDSQ